MLRFLFYTAIVLWVSIGCSSLRTRPAQIVADSSDNTLPIEWSGDYILVKSKVNGQGDFNFILDSGAPITFVSPELADRFPDDTFTHWGRVKQADGTSSFQSRAMQINQLQADGISVMDFEAMEVDLTNVSSAFGVRVDGILSYSVFDGYLLTIDYPQREVRVHSGRLSRSKSKNVLRTGFRHPDIPVIIGDKTFICTIDTGGGGGVTMPDRIFENLPFKDKPSVISHKIGVGKAERSSRAARLAADARLGDHRIKEPIISTGIHDPYLGVGLLRNFCITFDCANALVRFVREKTEPITMPPMRSCGVTFRRQKNSWTIWRVVPSASKEALNLKEGDQVVKINGAPVEKIGSSFSSQLESLDGITIEVERRSSMFKVFLPYKILVQ